MSAESAASCRRWVSAAGLLFRLTASRTLAWACLNHALTRCAASGPTERGNTTLETTAAQVIPSTISSDRANAARRLLVANGVKPSQVNQVRGFADQNLRDPAHPEDAKNRRVSMIVRYQNAVKVDEEPDKEGATSEHAGAKESVKETPKEKPKEAAHH